jgi:hypothetical protein
MFYCCARSKSLPVDNAPRRLELPRDDGLIDHRPDGVDLPVGEPIKDVLGERDPLALDRKAEQFALGRAIEDEPRCDMGRLDNDEIDLEDEVGDRREVAFKHCSVAREAELFAVPLNIVTDIVAEMSPILAIEAIDVVTIAVAETFAH